MTSLEIFFTILMVGAITFALRAAPFIGLVANSPHPVVELLRKYMPPGMMLILVVYSFTGYPRDSTLEIAAPYLATAFTIGVYLLTRRSLVAIVVGLAFYIVLVNGWLSWVTGVV